MIHHYIYAKYLQSLEDFNIDHLENFTLVFKYKRVKLENVFGFVEAKITVPDNLTIPLLPCKVDNETLHPLGS